MVVRLSALNTDAALTQPFHSLGVAPASHARLKQALEQAMVMRAFLGTSAEKGGVQESLFLAMDRLAGNSFLLFFFFFFVTRGTVFSGP